MLRYGHVHFNGKRMFAYRVNCASSFFSLTQECRELLQISTFTKLYDITGHEMFNTNVARHIRKVLSQDIHEWPDDLKRSILFQKRPYAELIVRMGEMTEKERADAVSSLTSFCNYWENFGKKFRRRKHL